MKKLICTFLLCLGAILNANETVIFEDIETGLVMEVPQGLSHSWEISHTPTGSQVNVFHTDDLQEQFYLVVLGKFPCESLFEEDEACLYPFFLNQIQMTLGEEGLFDDEDFSIEMEELDSFMAESNAQTYRIRITDLGEGLIMPVDIHVLVNDGIGVMVLTGMFPCEDESLLDAFSGAVLEGVHFTEE